MPLGLLVVCRNAETTLRRFSARVFFWPLPVRMISRRRSDSSARSKVSRRSLRAAAPIEPEK